MSALDEVVRPIVACRVINTALGFGRVVNARLDSGSDRDFISQSMIKELKLDTWMEFMTVKILDNTEEGDHCLTSRRRLMRIKSVDANYLAEVEGALVGQLLTRNNDILPAKRNLSALPHLSSLVFEDHDADLDMIIGVAHIHTWVASEFSRGAPNQSIGINTAFGWTMVGSFKYHLQHFVGR